MDSQVITVSFVTYLYQSQLRRVGPMPTEAGEAFARELSRRSGISSIRLEKWACVDSKEFSK